MNPFLSRCAPAGVPCLPLLLLLHACLLLGGSRCAGADAPRRAAPELWLYCPTNLLVDKNVDDLGALFVRAHASGYTRILIADSKFCLLGILGDNTKPYLRNVHRTIDLARASQLELVPAILPIGYSSDLLSKDPDLAEALPVRDAHYVVDRGCLRLEPDPVVALPDLATPERWSWKDPVVVPDAGAVRVQDPTGNARIVQAVTLAPFREYDIRVTVRTKGFTGTPEVKVLSGDDCLSFSNLGASGSEDWTVHHTVFNSLNHTSANIYFGQWGPASGTLWWKDAHLEECGLINLVRRPGAPVVIRRAGGGEVAEGAGVDRLADPLMGHRNWPGDYDVFHAAPTIHSSLPDGTQLRLSYYHTITVGDGQVNICPSEPGTRRLIEENIQQVHDLFQAKAYFLSHDEIRVLGWDESCTARHLTPGQILADNVATCIADVHRIAPGAHLYIWSDMFDPNHNAHDHYYLVNGDLTGSWLGLGPGLTIALWNAQTAGKSADFFSNLHEGLMIAGYYDAPVAGVHQWLKDTVGHAIDAVMYTTWRNDYSQLEAFAAAVRVDPTVLPVLQLLSPAAQPGGR